jgi:ribosomal protein S18 acetylase RimI-like enzyme
MPPDVSATDAITSLAWDSAHFRIRVAQVNSTRLTPALATQISAWLKQNAVDCLYFLATPEAHTLRLAAELGFRFVGARVTLESSPRDAPPDPRLTRPAAPADMAELRRIAAESHHDSRFYLDGKFRREDCDQLYRLWITKGFTDKDGAVFVADLDGRPAGYISINATARQGHISLLAVDAQYRGRRLATELLRRADSWFRSRDVATVIVPTQAGNIPALRLYGSYGFLISKIEPWYHRWTAEA